jgi:hypothetical protein
MATARLGKKPATKDVRDLKAVDFIDTAIATPPANFGHGSIFHDGEDPLLDWGMNANGPDPTAPDGAKDGVGDCVFAAKAHTVRAVNKVQGRHVVITGLESVSDYSAVTGYRVGDPSTDQGTDMRQAHKYHQKVGILDHAWGRHRIAAYAAIEAGNWDEMMQVAWSFDAVEFGFQFQQAQYDQFASGVWDYVNGSPIEGGHAVAHFGRRTNRGGIVSWGQHVWVTRAFVENLVDEAWGLVYLDSFNRKGVNDRGLNVTDLEAALNTLGVTVGG